MREEDWLECNDPDAMLAFLSLRAGGRKFRLFVCACCRRAWHLLREDTRKWVEVVERHVDGLASLDEVNAASRQADLAWFSYQHVVMSAAHGLLEPLSAAIPHALRLARGIAGEGTPAEECDARFREERAVQAALLHDVYGNPFRVYKRERGWITFQNHFAFKLALTTYRNRTFDDLPILADAVEEAGCTDAAILSHLRSAGPHVRGCWALDLILGKR
jgi:hypothetical protein